MNRLFLVFALVGLCVTGCKFSTGITNDNKAAATPSPTASATPAAQSSRPSNTGNAERTGNNPKGDVTGAYFPSGSLPGEFSEIEHLGLATIDENGNPAPLNGFIRPKRRSAKDYDLVSPSLNGNNLTFTTKTVDGVGYSFTGTFLKMDNFSANPPPTDEVILRGTLKKTRDGEVIAETNVNFTYSAGG